MSAKYIIKLLLFASALGWSAVNIAGTYMALRTDGSGPHVATHVALAVGCGIVAWFLRPRRRPPQPAVADGDRRVEVLEAEVSDLQRQLHETKRSLDFTQQLLGQRPESRKEQP